MKENFYRLEHPIDKIGPYFSNIKFEDFLKNNGINDHDKHLLPFLDELLVLNLSYSKSLWDEDRIISSYRFGFCSLNQLKKWFFNIKMLKFLHNKHIVLNIYKVTKLYKGYSQAVINPFEHNDRNLVITVKLTTLIKRIYN